MIKLFIYKYLEKTESKVLRWIVENHFKVLTFIIPAGLFIFISKLPYFNLFLRGAFAYVLVAILALFVFNVSSKKIIIVAIFSLFMSLGFLLLRLYIPAIRLFDFTFGFLVVAFIKFIGSER